MSKFTEDFNPTEEQINNLKELSRVLKTGVKSPKGYSFAFDMGTYFTDLDNCDNENDVSLVRELHNQCDSSACAMGVAVIQGIGYRDDVEYDDISQYARMELGTNEKVSMEGQYMFGPNWDCIDNTPEGAAARIDYVLEHGLPVDWREQMCGVAPLSYK